jgi:hypothetical protein
MAGTHLSSILSRGTAAHSERWGWPGFIAQVHFVKVRRYRYTNIPRYKKIGQSTGGLTDVVYQLDPQCSTSISELRLMQTVASREK